MERPNSNDYVLDGYEKALDKYHTYLISRIDQLESTAKESITPDWQSIIGIILSEFSTEMESYSYYGSNRGIPEDMYKDVAQAIMEGCCLK